MAMMGEGPRAMGIFIIFLFNRLVLTLAFLPAVWFLITIPSGLGLLGVTYLLRQTFVSYPT
jgi:hypothetical protein